jgi:hypothetical protein
MIFPIFVGSSSANPTTLTSGWLPEFVQKQNPGFATFYSITLLGSYAKARNPFFHSRSEHAAEREPRGPNKREQEFHRNYTPRHMQPASIDGPDWEIQALPKQ